MGRRRALATLAGAAAGGLAVGGWDLWHARRPHGAAADVTATRAKARPLPAPGRKVWSFPVNSSVGSVAVADGVVYAGTAQDTVFALDAATGRLLWHRATSTGMNQLLALAGPGVVVADPDNGGLLALDAATGNQAWTVKASDSGILGLVAGGDRVFAGIAVKSSTTGGVTAFGARSGDLLWTYEFGPVSDTNAGLAVAGDVVYGTTTDGEAFGLSTATGTRLWRVTSKHVAYAYGPQAAVVDGGVLYAAGDSAFYAIRTETGRMLWRVPSAPSAGLAVAGGVVFAGITTKPTSTRPDAGGLMAVDATTGQRRWSHPVDSGVYLVTPGPDGTVYSGSNVGVLDAWRAGTGSRIWSFPTTGAPIASNIAVGDGVVYFGSNDHHVYAVAA